MFNVCHRCGEWTQNAKIIEIGGESFRVCISCNDLHPFRKLPIIFLTGASGVGKTTIGLKLLAMDNLDFTVIESDILWNEIYNTPNDDYRAYRESWLRICKNYNQTGKPTLLIGCTSPNQNEDCIERRYFSESYYLALTRNEEEIVKALTNRPNWREASSAEYIKKHLEYNKWLINNSKLTNPKMILIDISGRSIDESTHIILNIISKVLNEPK